MHDGQLLWGTLISIYRDMWGIVGFFVFPLERFSPTSKKTNGLYLYILALLLLEMHMWCGGAHGFAMWDYFSNGKKAKINN